jgi:hypothetical protein
MKTRLPFVLATIAASALLFAQTPVRADDAPKVSTFAPADDLVAQVAKYVKAMNNVVADEQEYKDSEGKLTRDANTLAIIFLALGLHDQDNKYRANAADLLKAAQDVAATKDFASAQKAVAALEAAIEKGAGTPGSLKWEKVASLPELMKQVPMVNTKLKLYVKGKNFKKKAKDTAGYSAVIAAIAQGSIADTSATKNADEVKQWQKFSKTMRDNAGDVNAAIHKANEPAVNAAMKKLNQSCEDCHKVFKPDVTADKLEAKDAD